MDIFDKIKAVTSMEYFCKTLLFYIYVYWKRPLQCWVIWPIPGSYMTHPLKRVDRNKIDSDRKPFPGLIYYYLEVSKVKSRVIFLYISEFIMLGQHHDIKKHILCWHFWELISVYMSEFVMSRWHWFSYMTQLLNRVNRGLAVTFFLPCLLGHIGGQILHPLLVTQVNIGVDITNDLKQCFLCGKRMGITQNHS